MTAPDARGRRSGRRLAARRTVVAVVAGRRSPAGSVAAGFAALEAGPRRRRRRGVVLVHDGARPLVDAAIVRSVIAAAAAHGAADPDPADRRDASSASTADSVGATVDRDGARRRADAAGRPPRPAARGLRAVPARRRTETWTDEAALLEACRIPVHVVPGDPSNLKVTRPADLASGRGAPWPGRARPGSGSARTATRSGRARRSPSAASPSTARRACTATPTATSRSTPSATRCSAPPAWATSVGCSRPTPSTPEGIASARACSPRSSAASRPRGWRVGNVDLTIVGGAAAPGAPTSTRCATPSPGCSASTRGAVNVKASTGNLAGDEGAGRSISALAVATLEPVAVTRPPARHADRRDPAVRAARRRRRDLLVRADGLRPGPHRQLPVVPVRRPARPPPALARATGPLGHEHHRRRRQDHPRRRRGRDRRSTSSPTGTWPASSPTPPRSG